MSPKTEVKAFVGAAHNRRGMKRFFPIRRFVRAATTFCLFGSIFVEASAATSHAHAAQDRQTVRSVCIIEDHAEKLAYRLVHGQATIHEIHALNAAWPRTRRTLEAQQANSADLGATDAAIRNLNASAAQGTALAANNVTRTLIPLFAVARDRVPTYVHRLDYIGRQIEIDATRGSWAQAAEDVRYYDRTWAYYKAAAAKVRGHERASRLFTRASPELHRATQLRDARRAKHATTEIKTAVDLLENLYHR